jgi:hypothetical protein
MVDSSNNKTVAMKGAYFYGERRDSFSREEAVGSSRVLIRRQEHKSASS